MAVTIPIEPSDYIRVYDTNTAYYRLHSFNYKEINYNFLITIKNAAGDILSVLKLTSDVNGYGYYNPTGYLSNYLTSDVDINEDAIIYCPYSYGLYTLEFTEQYGDPVVVYTGTTTSTKFYYNGCQIYENWKYSEGFNHWLIANGSTDGHILSPVNKFYLDSSEKMWFYFITRQNTNFDMDINYYDIDNVHISTSTYPITPSANRMYRVGAGPDNPPTGSTPSNWDYYTINFWNIGEDYFGTDLPTIYRKNKCEDGDWSEVYWLNQDGGWSNFLFNKRKYTDYKIGRKSFDKFLEYGYSDASTFTPQRQITQYQTEVDEFLILNTDWINDDQNLLIKSLMFSPDVRIKQVVGGVDKLIHYNITDTKYREKNKDDDGLYQYEINMVPSDKKVIQSF